MERREHYILSLEAADRGNLRPFIDFLATLATGSTDAATLTAEGVLSGKYHKRHGNGGVTVRDRDGKWRYRPPEWTPRELLILEGRAAPAPGERTPDVGGARPS